MITNVAAYKFAPLSDLKPLRATLQARTRELSLKGTILLSEEGINLFLAGPRESVDALMATLRAVPGLEDLAGKYSESDAAPFKRMNVKIKKEIIAFGIEGIDPARRPSPRITPLELKAWLDSGKPLTLLDTRNDYEVSLGTFDNAKSLGIDHFRHFPDAARALPEELKRGPVVTFCTGGIRCEKAGPYLQHLGFENVYQLDGGILKYFEDCGNAHYRGECFVFDHRVGVGAGLEESASEMCFACQTILSPGVLSDPRYSEGRSCPACYQDDRSKHESERRRHQQMLFETISPLPGSVPKENDRPVKVTAPYDGLTLLDFLAKALDHVSAEEWRDAFDGGAILNAVKRPARAEQIVKTGDRYYHRQALVIEPAVNADARILFEDDALIVIDKPAPLPVHPCGRFNRNSLQEILRLVYAPQKPRPAHRLDANTTGVQVFTRTAKYAGLVQPQFDRGEVRKEYLARVIGHPPDDAFRCDAPISATCGSVGSRVIDEKGLHSITQFEVLTRLDDGTTLLKVRPLTGRTNQIRVHLWHLGWPIVGDPLYLPGGEIGETQTLSVNDPPMMLHAANLGFRHPVSGEPVTFTAPEPAWTLALGSTHAL